MEFFNVKYIPTGFVYSLAKEEVDRLVVEEPYNFEVVDENYNKPVEEEKEPTVYEKIVVEKEQPIEEVQRVKKKSSKKK